MGTRNIPFTDEELRLISQWANSAEKDLDTKRMLARIGSPQEASYEADQQFVQNIMAKLAGRESVGGRS